MLRNTFIHLPHIGQSTEKQLWSNGIITWQDLLESKSEYVKRFYKLKHMVKLSEHKLQQRDPQFFTDRLTTDQHWRILPNFLDDIVYLDIETTGLGGPKDHITTISLYDGKKIYTYVHGKNIEQFREDIKKYKVLVSYNGKCFDVPFIEREFGIRLPHAHLDLRYILKSLGIQGGLKSCERQLGLARGDLEGVDGYFAVLLWKDFCNGNNKALDTLLAYNIEDTVNLEKLMMYAFEKKIESIPLGKDSIISIQELLKRSKEPQRVRIPYEPDQRTIEKIKSKYYR